MDCFPFSRFAEHQCLADASTLKGMAPREARIRKRKDRGCRAVLAVDEM